MMLLDELQERWVQSGDDCFLPNAQIFVSVLYALSNSGTSDAIGKGIQLVERLKVLYEQNHRDPDLACRFADNSHPPEWLGFVGY